MSRNRTSPDAGWVDLKALPRGPNGRALCRRCGQEVPKGRRSFCSEACVDAWSMLTNPSFVRAKVFERDHGVCVACGLDTEALSLEQVERLWHIFSYWGSQHRWEAHHIVAVQDGGGETNLGNYQTLCRTCHPAATKQQNDTRRRREREQQGIVELPL